MVEPSRHQILTRLAAQDATIAALRTEIGALRRGRRPRPLIPTLIVALFVALTPVGLLAAGPFIDLDSASPHNGNIEAIRQAGVTRGCDPPDFTQYCPKDNVTREEMASFLARLGGLGDNPPVANAKSAQTAANAVALDGRAANGLVRVARTIVPNNLLASPPQPAIEVTAAFPAFQPIGTVVITAPTSGFVLLTAQSFSVTGNQIAIYMRLREGASGEVSPAVSQGVGVGVAASPVDLTLGSDLNATLTSTHVFPVAAAGTFTFMLEAATNNPSSNTKHGLFDTTITALFVPFGHDGGTSPAP